MPQMDGSIRIVTKIITKDAEESLSSLEYQIKKSAKYIDSLRSKMDALKDQKIPTQTYKDLQNKISKAEKEMERMIAQDSKLSDADVKIKKLSQSSADYAEKMREVANAKIPTQEYTEVQKLIDATEKKLTSLYDRKEKFLATGGKEDSTAYKKMVYDAEALEKKLENAEKALRNLVDSGKVFTLGADTEEYKNLTAKYESVNQELEKQKAIHIEIAQKQAESVQKVIELKAQMQQLVEEGKDFTLGQDTAEYRAYERQIQYEEEAIVKAGEHYRQLQQINGKAGEYSGSLSEISDKWQQVLGGARKAFNALNSGVKKADSLFSALLSNVKKAFSAINKGSKESNASLSSGFKTILKYGFGIRSLYVLFNKIRSGIKAGFANFINYSADFANSIQSMKNSMSTLSNQIAAAFAPIVQLVIPWLTKLIGVIFTAMTCVAQFIAILGGKSTFVRAKQVQDGYNKSLGGTAAAAKKAYGALAKFDDLDVLQKQEDTDLGGGAADAVGDLFEEVPVDDWMKDIVEKFKDFLSKLFYPLKEAWKREGQFVMDAWQYALQEVWKLIKDIGRDFLIMWQEEATIKIFQDILHIIGDIGLIIGHLARNFRDAWNENKTGLNILRNIRDIIGIIVKHIRNAADATVEWADKIDFRPLLKAINRFLESMKPLVDAVWGVLEDFYTKVLIPLSKWVLEKGLPDLLQVFIDFNEKVDWASLRQSLAEFWEHLEPFAETVGEGLIIFIKRVSDALAGFLNSQEFKDFLKTIEDWMDSVTPQDVADALETVAKGLIALKVALLGFSTISSIVGILTTIKTFLSFFGVSGEGAGVAGSIETTSTALGGFVSVLGDFAIATTGAIAVGNIMIDKTLEMAEAAGVQSEAIKDATEKYDGWLGPIRLVKDEIQGLILGMEGLPVTIASSVGAVDALNKAMEAVASGTIYSDEQLRKMQETWGFTADDVEMLRQEMLDTHPELRNLADAFPALSEASAETLSQISKGFEYIKNGVTETDDIIFRLNHNFGELNPTTEAFFNSFGDGTRAIEDVNYELETGEQVIDGYVDSLNKSSESMLQFSLDVSEAGENMSNGFSAAAEEIASTAVKIADTAIESGENIGKGVSEGMIKADLTTAAESLFDAALTAFNAAAGINSPAKNMEPSGEYLALGVAEGFRNKIDAFNEPITQLLTFITTKFTEGLQIVKDMWVEAWTTIQESTIETWTGIQEWFVEYWTIFIEYLTETWENILLVFTEKWEEIQLLFNNFIDFLNTVFLVAWMDTWNEAGKQYQIFYDLLKELSNDIKEMLTIFMNDTALLVDTKWKDTWDNAQNIFAEFEGRVEEIVGELRAIIQEFYDWAMSLFKEMISAIDSVGSAIESAGSAATGFSGVSSRISTYNIISTPVMDIPHLASGSVIRGGNPFLAMLGDQPHGQTNIEAPLSTIEQAVDNVMNRRGNIGGVPVNINLNWDGETFARLSIPDFLAELARQGYDVDVLGVT